MISILFFKLPTSPLQTKLHPEYLLCFFRILLTYFTMVAISMVKQASLKGNKVLIPLISEHSLPVQYANLFLKHNN